MRRLAGNITSVFGRLLIMVSLLVGVGSFCIPTVNAAELGQRSLELSSNAGGDHGVSYNVGFSIATAGTVGSIEFQFCSNSTFINEPCTAPFGLDANNVTIASQSMSPSFAISPNSSVNDIILERLPSAAVPGLVNFRFDNMVNPTNDGSYYLRVATFATNDATGSPRDSGGMAFVLNNAVTVSTEVPPYIAFCTGTTITGTNCATASGDFIDLGEFSPSKTSGGMTQFVAATNAQGGYNVYANGTTLTSGNNEIPAMSANGPPQIGVSQFGINLRANSNPPAGQNPSGPGSAVPAVDYNQPNLYRYNSGEVIATSSSADDYRKYTVTYMVNVGKNQAVGIYASTFTYVALGNF